MTDRPGSAIGPTIGPTSAAVTGAHVRALLLEAATLCRGTPEEDGLRESLTSLDGPLRVAFAGRVKAGKSTLLNALVGQRLAATDATECTRVVTAYVDGPATRAWAHPRGGFPVQVPFVRAGGQTRVELGSLRAEDLERLVVETPNARLRRTTLIDTPGIGSARGEVSARTEAFLVGSAPGADAVLYLLRHLHSADTGFLAALQDDQGVGTSPVNAVGVLSRADEIAGGRLDSLGVAAGIAARYAADVRVRALVQTVVPVAGLLALGAVELTERHFATTAALAGAPASLLLSADLLLDSRPDVDPAREARAEVLDLLGLFGVRLAVHLVRTGAMADAVGLAAALQEVSGLEDVRALLLQRFVARASTLKARAAVRAVELAATTRPGPEAATLRRRVEGVLAGAHDLVELRTLEDLRTGELDLGDEAFRSEAELLLGGEGDDARVRLGLAPAEEDAAVRDAAVSALHRWQRRAQSPVATPDLRRTADVLRRTCEGVVVGG